MGKRWQLGGEAAWLKTDRMVRSWLRFFLKGLAQLANVLLPLPAVKKPNPQATQVYPFQATHIDVNFIRVRAGNVKRVDATGAAKVVFGRHGVELISCQGFLGRKKGKMLRIDNEVEVALFGTNGAVALNDLFQIRLHLKLHLPAVTASSVSLHGFFPFRFILLARIAVSWPRSAGK